LICSIGFDRKAEELSMPVSNVGVEIRKKGHVIPDRSSPGPMPRQDAGGSYDHEMHPQELMQLVGCHDRNAGSHDVAHRLH
jgi:hypothetical protein